MAAALVVALACRSSGGPPPAGPGADVPAAPEEPAAAAGAEDAAAGIEGAAAVTAEDRGAASTAAMRRAPGEPVLRVGIEVGVDTVTISSPGGVRISDGVTGRRIARLAPDSAWRFGAARGYVLAGPPAAGGGVPTMGPGLSAGADANEAGLAGGISDGSGPAGAGRAGAGSAGVRLVDSLTLLSLEPAAPDAPIVISGRPFRGAADVFAVEGARVTVVNRVPLEAYLLGVVPAEIGPRTPEEFAAVEAQAVAARTYAVANIGRHAEMGFDLFSTVQDQVYGGMDLEREDATRAIRETAGRVLTWNGRPIRALYHSTCGGHTAEVTEVLARPPAPYLRSVSDLAPDGTAYCAISPKFRWTAVWSPGALNGSVRREIGRHFGVRPEAVGSIAGAEVRARTATGRVLELALRGPGGEFALRRNDIRFILRDASGRILNSTDFELVPAEESGGLAIHGRGYGHGVGMCQWGAIGRARAGHSFPRILRAYYPGTELTRLY